jgi:hypothetical protein
MYLDDPNVYRTNNLPLMKCGKSLVRSHPRRHSLCKITHANTYSCSIRKQREYYYARKVPSKKYIWAAGVFLLPVL